MLSPLTHRLTRRQTLALVAAGLALSLLVGLLAQRADGPLRTLDRTALDTLVRATANGEAASATVAVDIDDASLAAVGQWPWPRYRVGTLVQQIAEAGPSAIALDILFAEADRSSLASLRSAFQRDFGIELSFSGVPPGLQDNDGYLGQVLGRTDAVAARYFYFDHQNLDAPARKLGVEVDGRTELVAAPTATGVLENVAPIAGPTRLTGFINSPQDDDGLLRRLPLLIRHNGRLHTSLALTAVMRAIGAPNATVEETPHGLQLRVGLHRVPIDREGQALLRFSGGPAQYPVVQAVDLLNNTYRPEDLRGKVVFVGSSAVGLGDLRATALDPLFPGLQIQAAMAENILRDQVIATPDWTPSAVLAGCVLAGALMVAVFGLGNGLLPFLAGSAAVALAAVAGSAALFIGGAMFVSPAGPLVVAGGLFLVFLAGRFGIEARRARAWRKQLDNARQVTIESMASVAETRDPETGAHIKRTQNYVRAIALELRRSGYHGRTLTDSYIDLLYISAPLHDIGKVGVPDHILLKPGRLTPQEMELMKLHAEFGRQVICNTAQRIEGENFLTIAGDIAATHHEKWDGSGYPLGLAGDAIPLAGRIMAAADIYDALISRRCYKEPFSHEKATSMMREMRGTTFDPTVLDAFFRIEDEILQIAERFRDDEEAEHAAGAATGLGAAVAVAQPAAEAPVVPAAHVAA